MDEVDALLSQRKRGFKRSGPQAQSEPRTVIIEFPCNICGRVLESSGLLEAHLKTHESKSTYKCKQCKEIFDDEIKLKRHTEVKHNEIRKRKIKEYNCSDCSFQGENSLELKKHTARSGHNPCEYKEQCYTCDKEFSNYFHLMNHRKEEHPSNKICRYFLKKECIWDANACWYKHVNESEEMETETSPGISCDKCEKRFVENKDFRMHMKKQHPSLVARCIKFRAGTCDMTSESCWFLHEELTKKGEEQEEEDISQETDTRNDDSVFCEATNKTPPDPLNHILEMIRKLSRQVNNLEMMAQKSK